MDYFKTIYGSPERKLLIYYQIINQEILHPYSDWQI